MRNKIPVFLMAIICFILLAQTCVMGKTYENLTDLGLTSKSAILMEANSKAIIYEQNSHEAMPPASITKIMTLLLIYDAIAEGKIGWEDQVTVSPHAASMGGSQVFLEAGEVQTVETMVKCIAIASANDASVAMAEYISGSEEGFVADMNRRAAGLGMTDTNFVNACGLDADGHVTSAYDIALMSRELMVKYPEVKRFTTTWQDTIIHSTKKGDTEFGLTNTNKLIKWYNGATGLKTGSTSKAMYCLSGTAEKNGLSLVGVVMAAPDFRVRFHEVMKLFDYGVANYQLTQGMKAGEPVGVIPVEKGVLNEVETVVKDSAAFLTQKGSGEVLDAKITMSPSLSAPFEAGVKAGEIIYTINGTEVGRSDIVTSVAVAKATPAVMAKKLILNWF